MNHDYKAALEAMNDEDHIIDQFDKDFPLKETIINALKLAEKVNNPSEAMFVAATVNLSKEVKAHFRNFYRTVLKYILAQAQKEIDDETA